ncbi:MAG: hypothetical protein K5924_12600 [Chloroflexi bacterium]|nr:hypothetical protein [Chloroflexota bacterium]
MPSLIIEITVRDPELLGNGISKRMELRGQTQVPASMLKPVSAAITLDLIDDLKSARGQANKGNGQLELIPLESDPLRPLNPIDDGFVLGESLNDAIAAFLKEDAELTQLETDAREAIGDAIALMRGVLPTSAGVEMAMMSALDALSAMAPADAISLVNELPVIDEEIAEDELRIVAIENFLEHRLGIVIDYQAAESAETVDPDTGEITGGDQDDRD